MIFHFPGNNPFSGDVKGRDEIFALFGRIQQKVGQPLQQEIHDVTSSDEHAVALVTARLDLKGTVHAWRRVLVYHVAGGKINEIWAFEGDQALVDRILSS